MKESISEEIATLRPASLDMGSVLSFADGVRDLLADRVRVIDSKMAFSAYQGYYWDKWRQTLWYSAAPFFFCSVSVSEAVVQSRRSGKDTKVPVYVVVGRESSFRAFVDAVTDLENFIVEMARKARKDDSGNRAYEREKVTQIATKVCEHLESSCKSTPLAEAGLSDVYDSEISEVNRLLRKFGETKICEIVSDAGGVAFAEDHDTETAEAA